MEKSYVGLVGIVSSGKLGPDAECFEVIKHLRHNKDTENKY